MLVAPSDHVIPDAAAFRAAVAAAPAAARAGGSSPSASAPTGPRPATAGWNWPIRCPRTTPARALPLRFVEKPDAARAAEMLAGGRHLWNAGIFLFSVRAILDAFAAHAPACSTRAAGRSRRNRPRLPAPRPRTLGRRGGHLDRLRGDGAARNLAVVPFAAAGRTSAAGTRSGARRGRTRGQCLLHGPCHRDRLPGHAPALAEARARRSSGSA
jgi:mannose-1-phosphate guanylyltransferase / mannose-6-phosphate isomerase